MMTIIRIEVESPYVDQIIAYLQTLPSDKRGKISIDPPHEGNSYIESWYRYKEERSKKLASLSIDEAWNELYGKE